MKTSNGAYHQCFNGQALVDAQAQVIVVAELSDQSPDVQQLEPVLAQLLENLEALDAQLPAGAALSADAGYCSEANVAITAEHGLDAHMRESSMRVRSRLGSSQPSSLGRAVEQVGVEGIEPRR